ncbi:hypothetical protein J2Z21_008651 [Streptomyces griseochromogenes]|uniref:Uncharacterized protein n=1 Tax=Streptomyces griseochromogenes TaxID=68214 RepID=A0ABS4M7I7_9ACTN|nr:hypothetical protein [Streptomyces griseochromogenes]MBP2055635.1 hypothetical protein [Streptomyces griseochromogenes]
MDTPFPVPVTGSPTQESGSAAHPWADWPTLTEILAAVLAPRRLAAHGPRTPEDR